MPHRELHAGVDERTMCVCHDLERGLGRLGTDERLRAEADAKGQHRLERMLAIEEGAGVRVTYNVVGAILLRDARADRAARALHGVHSYDHSLSRADPEAETADQLALCRELDYRPKGYRPPNSVITSRLGDTVLAFHNFEWLGSSVSSLGFEAPRLSNRVVRLPIALDDHPLNRGELGYDEWDRSLLATVRSRSYSAVSLHDCYGPWWLDPLSRAAGPPRTGGSVVYHG